MIRNISLALTFLTISSPAFALSCMRPDVVSMLEFARKSEDVYYVIKGRVTPTSPYTIPEPKNGADSSVSTPVVISGTGLGQRSFSVPVEVGAIAKLNCLSVWCAGPPAEGELLMILRKSDEELILDVGPCGGTAISWSVEAEKRLLECHRSGKCERGEF
ncbi:MAG: hypothetical protein ABJF50_03180 [Paracoccaceae bacterium]